MVSLLLSLAWASEPDCRVLPQVDEALARPPAGWPSYPGRCLDQGSPDETLLERARRCAALEPEDDDVMRVLGLLGDESDVPRLEAVAHAGGGWLGAIDGLERLDLPEARRALTAIRCHMKLPEDRGLPYTGTRSRSEPSPVDGVAEPVLSRERVPTRDAAELAARARADLAGEDVEGGLFLIGWVGDDSDLEAIAAHSRESWAAIRAIAALGTDRAVAWLLGEAQEYRGDAGLWGHAIGSSRTHEAWQWLLEHPHSGFRAGLAAMLRPEAHEAMAARAPNRTPSAPERRFSGINAARSTWSWIAALQAGTAHAGHLRGLAHRDSRWLLIDALPTLSEPDRHAAIDALAEAQWGTTRPPDEIVQRARELDSMGAIETLVAAGETEQAEAVLRGDDPKRILHLVNTLETLSDPLREALRVPLDPTRAPDLHLLKAAMRHPEMRDELVPTIRAGAYRLPTDCADVLLLGGHDIDHDLAWLIERVSRCGVRDLRIGPALATDLFEALFEQGAYHQALGVFPDDASVFARALEHDDRAAQIAALKLLAAHGPLDGVVDQVVALAASEDTDLAWRALEVLTARAPERAIPLLAARRSEQHLVHECIRMLGRIGTDPALEALVPLLEEGRWRERVARMLRHAGGPVHEVHRATIDALLGVHWESTDGEPVPRVEPGPTGPLSGEPHRAEITVEVDSPNGRATLTGDTAGVRLLHRYGRGEIELAPPAFPTTTNYFEVPDSQVLHGVFSPDGTRVATAFQAGLVEVHHVASGERLLQVDVDGGPLGPHLAFDVASHPAPMTGCGTGEPRWLPAPLLTPSGGRLVTAGFHERHMLVRVWDVQTARPVQTWTFDELGDLLGWLPDGRILVHAGGALLALGDAEPEVLATEVVEAAIDEQTGGPMWRLLGEHGRMTHP